MKPKDAAAAAAFDAETAVGAAGVAARESKKVAEAKREIDQRFPTPHGEMVAAKIRAYSERMRRLLWGDA
jgi:tRNA(Arg) A34 adenosine deaminase TadA